MAEGLVSRLRAQSSIINEIVKVSGAPGASIGIDGKRNFVRKYTGCANRGAAVCEPRPDELEYYYNV